MCFWRILFVTVRELVNCPSGTNKVFEIEIEIKQIQLIIMISQSMFLCDFLMCKWASIQNWIKYNKWHSQPFGCKTLYTRSVSYMDLIQTFFPLNIVQLCIIQHGRLNNPSRCELNVEHKKFSLMFSGLTLKVSFSSWYWCSFCYVDIWKSQMCIILSEMSFIWSLSMTSITWGTNLPWF